MSKVSVQSVQDVQSVHPAPPCPLCPLCPPCPPCPPCLAGPKVRPITRNQKTRLGNGYTTCPFCTGGSSQCSISAVFCNAFSTGHVQCDGLQSHYAERLGSFIGCTEHSPVRYRKRMDSIASSRLQYLRSRWPLSDFLHLATSPSDSILHYYLIAGWKMPNTATITTLAIGIATLLFYVLPIIRRQVLWIWRSPGPIARERPKNEAIDLQQVSRSQSTSQGVAY